MKCPVCHQGEMVSGIKDIPYTFRGRKTVLKGIHGLYCVHCEESIMNKEEKKDIPYGYERITYSRCGDSEALEILRPASDNAGQESRILSPDITVSLETKSGLSASEIADRLKQILAEQANGGRK